MQYCFICRIGRLLRICVYKAGYKSDNPLLDAKLAVYTPEKQVPGQPDSIALAEMAMAKKMPMIMQNGKAVRVLPMQRPPCNPGNRARAEQPEEQVSHTPLSISMLISEWVYPLVLLVERAIRLPTKFIVRPCRLQYRCLFW
jgi:hypothetical protein